MNIICVDQKDRRSNWRSERFDARATETYLFRELDCLRRCKAYADFKHLLWHRHHAVYGDDEALFDIRTLEVIGGHLPRRALLLVLEWAQDHRAELMEDWDLCVRKQSPKKIAPLP